jgi:hypothetical protein
MSVDSGVTAPGPSPTLGQRFKAFKERNHVAFEVAFFFAGFLFDVVLLHRIDSTPLLIHQGLYLVLSAALIAWDHRLHVAGKEPEGWLGRVASYRLWVMHFFLGTLLNAFMVFYFRASSGLGAFGFIVGLAVLIVANELPRFRKQGPIVRVLLLSFAMTSYLAYLLPVLWGRLHAWQYVASVVLGSAGTVGLWQLFRKFTHDPSWTFQRAVAPGLVMQVVLLLLYVADVVPPVPLSLKHIGIYTAVNPTKDEQGRRRYALAFQPAPRWQFWEAQADRFVGPAGARAYAFVRIFAPTKFNDEVRFAWEYDDPRQGWTPRGAPFTTKLSGGGEEGYRTFAYSTMGRPGTYRVRVLTADEREIGRKTFTYVEGEAAPTRTTED